jgi:hypothetical protein
VVLNYRWHHLAYYLVVLGYKRFVDYQLERLTPRTSTRRSAGAARTSCSTWSRVLRTNGVERIIDQTDGVRLAAYEAFRVHVGATASPSRGLYDGAGGMDTAPRSR